MPELPEVETTRRGIEPHLIQRRIMEFVIRQPRLRWPVSPELPILKNTLIDSVKRRAKYILVETAQGTIVLHLGMSGSLRLTDATVAPEKHDHVDIVFDNGMALRLRDPRRFGAVLYSGPNVSHPLLANLGVEPLEEGFTGEHLYQLSQNRRVPIKTFLMDAHQVVGVGNIYANEALFIAGIHPERPASGLSKVECERLVQAVKTVLAQAIQQGGTTLRDFVRENGQTGYFQLALQVYGRSGEQCLHCQSPLQHIRQAQRSTWFCPNCQPFLT